MEPNYDSRGLQLSKIREEAKLRLVDILDASRGKKLLVLDHIVSGCLGMLTKNSLLVEHGVAQLRYLNDDFQDAGDAKSLVYIVRPTISNFKAIADQVSRFTRGGKQLEIQAYFQPRKSSVCERIFQAEGIAANIKSADFSIDFIPFDNDLLSLELQDTVKDVTLHRDWSSNFYMARGLANLQRVFGPILSVKGVGPSAKTVYDSMEAILDSQKETREFQGVPAIDELVIIDRACDLVTPFCTQLSYEGLIDELVGIKNGQISYETSGAGSSKSERKLVLNSGDETHSAIRGRHIATVGGFLKEQTQILQKGYKESRGAEIKQLKEFTTKLKSLPQIQHHIDLLSHLQTIFNRPEFEERIQLQHILLGDPASDSEYQNIEDMMLREEKLEVVLRILCLASLTQGGIPKGRFETLRKEILTTYGHQHLLTLQHLQSAGLLRVSRGGKSSFQILNSALNLTPTSNQAEADQNQPPKDVSYVYSGYAPITLRLIEAALKGSDWSALSEEVQKNIPGPFFAKHITRRNLASVPSDKKKHILVAFAGGVTYAEIAAIRWLQSQPDFDANITIAASNFINAKSLVQSFQGPDVLQAASFASA